MASESRRAARLAPLALLALLLLAGCYSFKGSLPPHLKTVAIPLMENETSEIGVAEEITDLVVERFLADGLLKVGTLEAADGVLHLTLTGILEATSDYTADETVTKIKVTVKVKAVFEDLVEGRERWTRSFSEWGEYEPDSESRADAVREAVAKFVEAVNNQLLSEW